MTGLVIMIFGIGLSSLGLAALLLVLLPRRVQRALSWVPPVVGASLVVLLVRVQPAWVWADTSPVCVMLASALTSYVAVWLTEELLLGRRPTDEIAGGLLFVGGVEWAAGVGWVAVAIGHLPSAGYLVGPAATIALAVYLSARRFAFVPATPEVREYLRDARCHRAATRAVRAVWPPIGGAFDPSEAPSVSVRAGGRRWTASLQSVEVLPAGQRVCFRLAPDGDGVPLRIQATGGCGPEMLTDIGFELR
jgi:branched-subunit amino acid transport protein